MKRKCLNVFLVVATVLLPTVSFSNICSDYSYVSHQLLDQSCGFPEENCHELYNFSHHLCYYGFNFFVDYLYWNVCRSNLTIASPVVSNNINQLEDIHGKWSSGFRVNAGYRFCNDMQMNARYTYISSRSDREVNDTDLTRIDNANFKLNFNLVDLDIGPWVEYRCHTYFRPFAALRYVSIDNRFSINSTDIETPADIIDILRDNEVDAYGVAIGFDAKYIWFSCLDIVGRASFGGHYANLKSVATFEDATPTFTSYLQETCRALFSCEASVALEMVLCNICSSELLFSIGYEIQTWGDLQEIVEFNDVFAIPQTTGDYSVLFHGIFARLDCSF